MEEEKKPTIEMKTISVKTLDDDGNVVAEDVMELTDNLKWMLEERIKLMALNNELDELLKLQNNEK